ncbi:MAG TPA: MBL fold metallo-hydrolase [Gemmatimonadales bacterium]|nr:MBL fold metallo-hydrolase [Gemmatimonadales bacterium]
MSRLYVLGSGSRGNCCALECDGAVLLIDAGFSAREVERRARALGLVLGGVVGIALTHEHGDHACGAARLAERLSAPILTASGTWAQLGAAARRAMFRPLRFGEDVRAGPFAVTACATSHDAAEPVAVVVTAIDGARVGVAYDLGRPTAAVRYLLRELTALVLEANHDEVLLRTSGYPASVRQRIVGSGGHLSNRACAELIEELCHPGLAAVVLAHLSQRCNRADVARAEVEPALARAGYRGALYVAAQDEPLGPIALEPMTLGQPASAAPASAAEEVRTRELCRDPAGLR